MQKKIKGKMWLTVVEVVDMSKEEFVVIKEKLGTGGSYFKDKIELRGRVANRLVQLLDYFNYIEQKILD